MTLAVGENLKRLRKARDISQVFLPRINVRELLNLHDRLQVC